MRLVYRRALMQHRKKGVKPVEIAEGLFYFLALRPILHFGNAFCNWATPAFVVLVLIKLSAPSCFILANS
jgi:hypothetical protein